MHNMMKNIKYTVVVYFAVRSRLLKSNNYISWNNELSKLDFGDNDRTIHEIVDEVRNIAR